MKKSNNTKIIKKITIFGMLVNIILSCAKILFGYICKSSALIADGVHSFSDLLSDFAILFGVKLWNKSPDEKHPYGHSRLETFIALFIAFLLLFVSIGIVVSAITKWKHSEFNEPSFLVLIIAAVSIVSKEYLYRITKKVADKLNSSAVLVNALHHRSDSMSSIPVFISIILTMINPKLRFFDYLGAIVVAFFLLYFVFEIFRDIIRELMETSAPKDYLEKIEEIIENNKEINSYHCLRSRKVGSNWFIDLHIQINEDFNIRKGHEIAGQLKKDIKKNLDNIGDILVHIEPFEKNK